MKKVVVLDLGHTMNRVGWAHEDKPRQLVPPVKQEGQRLETVIKKARDSLRLYGEHQFSRHPLIITMSTDTQMKNGGGPLHRSASVAIEDLKFPLVCLASSATAQLRASGYPTGVVVELTATRSIVVPICQNQIIHHAIRKFEKITGNELDEYLSSLLVSNGRISGDTSCLKLDSPKIKAQFCK